MAEGREKSTKPLNIPIHFGELEAATVREAARRCGLPLSRFVREVAVSRAVRVLDKTEELNHGKD